jgi:hypothetical protein
MRSRTSFRYAKLMRHRADLVEMASRMCSTCTRPVTQMNVQIHHVISDITGNDRSRDCRFERGRRSPWPRRANARINATEETIRKSLVGRARCRHSAKESASPAPPSPSNTRAISRDLFAHVSQALRRPKRPIQDATVRHCWRTDFRPILNSESSVFRLVGGGFSVGQGSQSYAG